MCTAESRQVAGRSEGCLASACLYAADPTGRVMRLRRHRRTERRSVQRRLASRCRALNTPRNTHPVGVGRVFGGSRLLESRREKT